MFVCPYPEEPVGTPSLAIRPPDGGSTVGLVLKQATTDRDGINRLVEAFLRRRSPNTVRAYRNDLVEFDRFLERVYGVRDGDARAVFGRFFASGVGLANELMLDYRADLEARCAPATVNRRLAGVKAFARLARRLGIVSWELDVEPVPVMTYRDTRGPGVVAVTQILTLSAARTDRIGRRDHAMLRLLYDLALRCGEVVGLDLADLDLVEEALWVLGKGRTQKERLTLPAQTRAALGQWLAVRGRQPGPLFVSFSGYCRPDQRLTSRGLYRVVRGLGNAIGIKARPHGFRHTAITEAVKASQPNGIGLEEVQQFSRHRDINTLLIYRDRERNVQGKLAALVAESAHPSAGKR